MRHRRFTPHTEGKAQTPARPASPRSAPPRLIPSKFKYQRSIAPPRGPAFRPLVGLQHRDLTPANEHCKGLNRIKCTFIGNPGRIGNRGSLFDRKWSSRTDFTTAPAAKLPRHRREIAVAPRLPPRSSSGATSRRCGRTFSRTVARKTAEYAVPPRLGGSAVKSSFPDFTRISACQRPQTRIVFLPRRFGEWRRKPTILVRPSTQLRG